ncbi:MAG: hypothetical protein KatS3mg111_3839 [Pirellulaceae bacterium]|nr:MAG: hypothetical protein KatS3mg111_3839 [Pirellulaceae bacterium]
MVRLDPSRHLGDDDTSGETQRATRERLLEAAGQVFAQRGPQATVREICKKAGCSVAAINYYFGDKHQLYLKCVATACEHKKKLVPLPKFPADASPEQRLRVFLQALCRRVSAESSVSWHSTLMLREVLQPSEGVAELLEEPFREDFHSLLHILDQLLPHGAYRDQWRLDMATQIVARCMFLRTGAGLRKIVGLNTPANEDPQQYADRICDTLLWQINYLRQMSSEIDHSAPRDALTENILERGDEQGDETTS